MFLVFTLIRLRQIVAGQADAEARAFPTAAVSYVLNHRLPGPLLNHYNWGGYLIWKLYPDYRVYIDGRTDLYGDAFMDQSGATYNISNESWWDPLEKWQIRSVVLASECGIGRCPTLSEWVEGSLWRSPGCDLRERSIRI